MSGSWLVDKTTAEALPNHTGAQAFFTAEGRAFCLYAVLGNIRDRDRLAGVANQAISAIPIEVT